MKATFSSQMRALLWRNYLLKRRNMKQVYQEVLYPVFYLAILVMIKVLVKPGTKPAVHYPVNPLRNFSIGSNKTLLIVAPPDIRVKPVINIIAGKLQNANYSIYASQELAEEDYKRDRGNVAAGIIFSYSSGEMETSDVMSYAIRMPYDESPDTGGLFRQGKNQGGCRYGDNQQGTGVGDCDVNRYLQSGFVYLQNVIDWALMQNENISVPFMDVMVQLMPKEEYTPDLTYLQTIASIYFVMAYSFFINFLTVNLVAEKEKKIREGMFMMGLRNSVFWLSWSAVYFMIILLVTILVVLLAAVSKFFQQSNIFLLFIMLILYGLSIIALAFLLTPFFSKARTAGGVASFFTIVVSLLYLAVSQTRTATANGYEGSVPPGAQWAMCLLSPVALALAMDQGIFLDIAGGGMNFNTITLGDFPLQAPLIMLVVDTVLYFLLAIYLDHVIPGEHGVRYKPWYFLQSSYWCPRKHNADERTRLVENRGSEDVVLCPDIEPVTQDMHSKRSLSIINITKAFTSKDETVTAIKGLSLDMYEGHITALLGHNGAGKTTLINMLTGLMPPSSGTAIIQGLDISCSGDMEKIRSVCGICPQHNILYDDLTCREHLVMFAGIKGVPASLTNAEVERALNSVNLGDQADVFASKLSGGQKRKLSVAMALIGDPKIIFLDEPTAGMDPYSRRHLWSLLKNSKQGRLILLTTHFMDEADILADRKAIISKGKLKCCGSSLFLKTKFGIGYHLNMVRSQDCEEERVLQMLKYHVGGVELKRSHGKELAYIIPHSEVSNFPKLFQSLEEVKDGKTAAQTLGISSYGVSMPTLEEIFLKLEEDTEDTSGTSEGCRNPLFYNSVAHLAVHEPDGDAHESFQGDSSPMDPTKIVPKVQKDFALVKLRIWALMKIRFLLTIRSKALLLFQIILPAGLVAGGIVLSRIGQNSNTSHPSPLQMSASWYANLRGVTPFSNNYLLLDSVDNETSRHFEASLNSTFLVDRFLSGEVNVSDVTPHFLGVNILTADSMTDNILSYTALYNDTAIHSLPGVINSMSSAVLKMKDPNKQIIKTYSLPWPGAKKLTWDGSSFSSALMVGLAFVLVAPGFAVTVVYEAQNKIRSQLRVSGVTFNMYWGTVFIFSLLVYLIPAVTCLIIALAMKLPSFTPAGAVLTLILLFIVFIPNVLLLALVLSFMFSKFETCMAVLPNIYSMAGMVPYMTVSLLDMLTSQSIATALHSVFLVIDPLYAIFGGFYYIDKVYRTATFEQRDLTISEYFYFNNNILLCILMPLLHFPVLYLLLRILDVRRNGGTIREALQFGSSQSTRTTPVDNKDQIEDEDEDVSDERERVERLDQMSEGKENCAAYARQLRKEFTKQAKSMPCIQPAAEKVKVAVRNLSFAVNKGEVLGLLGPNGAGKTTALNMMIAEVHPDKGKVIVASHNVCSNMSEAFQALGYCAQHDALWDTITLEEHLECYAAVKGIGKDNIPVIVDYFVKNLKVDEHRKKHAKKLSGGTKRKLSYAMSMLGWPQIVLLDEPSTGMDPISKRFLWDTISSSFEGAKRGAILTTHYMEEADVLCSRVGIMVNGQLQCLGPTQHLKSKYGSGYVLEVKLSIIQGETASDLEERMLRLETQLQSLFPSAVCLESFAERAQYRIPGEDVSVLSATFAALETCKKTHGVEEYSFSQSTLEQVFLNFAKMQLEEGQDAENIKMKLLRDRQLSHTSDNQTSRTQSIHL